MKHTFIAVHWHPYITCCNEGSKLWLDGGCLIGKLKHVNNGHSHLRQSTLMFSTTNSSIQLDDVLRLRLRTCVTRLQLLLPATSAFMRSRAQLLILNSRLSSAEHNDSLARAGISAAVTMTRVLWWWPARQAGELEASEDVATHVQAQVLTLWQLVLLLVHTGDTAKNKIVVTLCARYTPVCCVHKSAQSMC